MPAEAIGVKLGTQVHITPKHEIVPSQISPCGGVTVISI